MWTISLPGPRIGLPSNSQTEVNLEEMVDGHLFVPARFTLGFPVFGGLVHQYVLPPPFIGAPLHTLNLHLFGSIALLRKSVMGQLSGGKRR